MHRPDFLASAESGPLESEPLHRCRASLLEDERKCHRHAGGSTCKAGPESVVLLLRQPILKNKIQMNKTIAFNKNLIIIYVIKIKKCLKLTICSALLACGVCPEV